MSDVQPPEDGAVVQGVVREQQPYGVIVDLPSPFYGLVEFRLMKDHDDGFGMEEYPPVGAMVQAVVVGVRNKCVYLSLREQDFRKFGHAASPLVRPPGKP